jgi:hypothetical protein
MDPKLQEQLTRIEQKLDRIIQLFEKPSKKENSQLKEKAKAAAAKYFLKR